MKKYFLLLIFTVTSFSLYSQTKPTVTILDFVGSGVSEQEKSIIIDYLSTSILESGQYRVIDRMQRDSVLAEIKFSLSGCTDQSCQLEAGKLLQADNIIVGSLGQVGQLYILNLKIIEVETGETINSISEKFTSLESLVEDSEQLVASLLQIPLKNETAILGKNNYNDIKKEQQYYDYLNKIDLDDFTEWLKEEDLFKKYTENSPAGRLFYVENYYKNIRKKWTFDLGLKFGYLNFYNLRNSSATDDYNFSIGLPIDFCYHTSNSFGISFGLAPNINIFKNEDHETRYAEGYSIVLLNPHLSFLFGNKKDFGISVGTKLETLFYDNYIFELTDFEEDLSQGVPTTNVYSGLKLLAIPGFSLTGYYKNFFTRININFEAFSYSGGPRMYFDIGYSF